MVKLLSILLLFTFTACTDGVNSTPPRKKTIEKPKPVDNSFAESHIIGANSTTYSEFIKLGVSAQEILALVEVSKPVHRLDRIAANTPFTLVWKDASKQHLSSVRFKLSHIKEVHFVKNDADKKWSVNIINHPVRRVKRTFTGTVLSSLWESASQSGMKPELIIGLTEIFAWQIDFSREVRKGDKWRLVVEEKFVKDQAIGWGYIIAAQYSNRGDTYTGVRYPPQDPMAAYYQEDGTSLRRMFLKSPIKFGRISSRFNRRRFHPILKRNRPHLGVDYAAPTGTPIRSVGDGKVVFAGRNGGSGKMIKIRHNSIYTTAYLHLNGYAKKIRRGAKVKQGQTIGYVGTTGLSTGPHLHFSFFKRGRYVDPLRIKFPSAKPISKAKITQFKLVSSEFIKELPDWKLAENKPEINDSFYNGDI